MTVPSIRLEVAFWPGHLVLVPFGHSLSGITILKFIMVGYEFQDNVQISDSD